MTFRVQNLIGASINGLRGRLRGVLQSSRPPIRTPGSLGSGVFERKEGVGAGTRAETSNRWAPHGGTALPVGPMRVHHGTTEQQAINTEALQIFDEVLASLAKDFDDGAADAAAAIAAAGGASAEQARAAAEVVSRPGIPPLVFPKELTFLNGAPGSGKSTNSKWMLDARGLSTKPIVMSSLLERDPTFSTAMACGDFISDRDVVELLFRELLQPQHALGALVDGFPRTSVQADCLFLLDRRMNALREARVAALAAQGIHLTSENLVFPLPKLFVCILSVGKADSVLRQLHRGRDARSHNARVRETGIGELMEERETDADVKLMTKRYETFEEHMDTVRSLMAHFPLKVIDASRNIEDVRTDILNEFQYQSKNDLSRQAFEFIVRVPLASRIGANARPALVHRLDEYTEFFPARFDEAVRLVDSKIIPQLRAAAFAGTASVRFPPESPENTQLSKDDKFPSMVVDTMAERGYEPRHEVERDFVPYRVLSETGEIRCVTRDTHVFHIKFPKARLSHADTRALNESRENEELETDE